MTIERLWAGWRTEYVSAAGPSDDGCVFCRILDSGEPDAVTKVVWRGDGVVAILNAYPYTSGHLMVMPTRHVGDIEALSSAEGAEVWKGVTAATAALKRAYSPDGINVGANLGRAAGAGVPGHFHVHLLPRWVGDTNFMTSVAEVRVMPETLDATWHKLTQAWGDPAAASAE
ncbi:MAG TPA: HIT domain-containing protein [Acidimicrobiales bacterium]|jgi:diadenosine tetraphosphate (Ap4A) HIT family hydrolase|nr:HIT domain-containing protein [Acidimicrobiales bacterium]